MGGTVIRVGIQLYCINKRIILIAFSPDFIGYKQPSGILGGLIARFVKLRVLVKSRI